MVRACACMCVCVCVCVCVCLCVCVCVSMLQYICCPLRCVSPSFAVQTLLDTQYSHNCFFSPTPTPHPHTPVYSRSFVPLTRLHQGCAARGTERQRYAFHSLSLCLSPFAFSPKCSRPLKIAEADRAPAHCGRCLRFSVPVPILLLLNLHLSVLNHTCTHTYTHTHIHTHTHTHTYTHMHLHTPAHTRTRTYTHTHTGSDASSKFDEEPAEHELEFVFLIFYSAACCITKSRLSLCERSWWKLICQLIFSIYRVVDP